MYVLECNTVVQGTLFAENRAAADGGALCVARARCQVPFLRVGLSTVRYKPPIPMSVSDSYRLRV